MRTLDLGTAPTLTIPQIQLKLTSAEAELTQVRSQAGCLRCQCLLALDQARALEQNSAVDKETRSRIRIEQQRAQG